MTTDSKTFAYVSLRGSSTTVSLETWVNNELPVPLGNGTIETDECADLNGDGQIDLVTHIVNIKAGTDRAVAYASEFHQEAPTIHNRILKDNGGTEHRYVDRYKLFSPHTGQLQARFEKEKAAANKIFEEFKAALRQGRVVPSHLWDTEFTVKDAAGKDLFRVHRIDRGHGETRFITLWKEEGKITISVESRKLLGPIEKQIDRLYPRQTISENAGPRADRGNGHHAHYSGRMIARARPQRAVTPLPPPPGYKGIK